MKMKRIISEETAYQMTSILNGAVERGTGKNLRVFKGAIRWKDRYN